MKRVKGKTYKGLLVILLITIMLVTSGLTPVIAAANLVVNGDFEGPFDNKGATSSAFITSWDRDLDGDSAGNNIGQTKINVSTGVGGTNSIRIGKGEGGRGQIIDNIPEGVEFTLSGWGKVSKNGEIGYLGVDCLDSKGRKLSGGKFGVEFTTTKYIEKTRTFKTVPGTTAVQVYVYKNPSEKGKETYAYFDNISLIQKGEILPEEILLKNGSFEQNKEFWDDWGNAFVIKDIVAKGTKAIKLLDDGGMGQIIEKIDTGKTFEISGFGKIDVAGEAAILGVDCFDGINPKPFKKFGIEFTTTEYEQKSLKFTIPERTVMLQVFIYKNPGNGAAYLDGIELKRADGEISGAGVITAVKPADYGVFFDDFINGLDPAKWLIGKAQWGGSDVNGGVIPENVTVNNGIVEITGRGDLYDGEIKGITRDPSGTLIQRNNGKRTGGVITTKDFYGSGRYEVRAKVLPQLGACSAFWTYFNDGKKNHEIDIEMPGEQSGKKAINKVMTTTWVVEDYNTTSVVDTPTLFGTKNGITDGEWHTYRFDWHTDQTEPRVEFYIDDVKVYTSTENIPFAAGRFWLGVWFPNNWAGVPNFDTDRMLIDWVRITPFNEEGDQWLKNYDSTWADLSEYPPMYGIPKVEPMNKHNFAYMHIAEMNDKRAFTEKAIRDFVQQLEDFGIEYQFCDVGFFDANGKMPQTEADIALTQQWIAGSRKFKPNQKIIATINGSLWEHVIKSENIRQNIANECARLVTEFKFDGIQVDMEPFRKEYNKDLIDLLKKIRIAIGKDKHLSIATTALEMYLPHEAIIEIANIVDMINPMLYDSNGPGVGEVDTNEKFIEFWRYNVLRYSKAIEASNNKKCQLSPTMPVYDTKGYQSSPGWPDPNSGIILYHLPAIENIKNAMIGLRQAISEGAKVYGSGIFWWGCFTSVQYDERDGQDYAKDRKWWMDEWVNNNLSVLKTN